MPAKADSTPARTPASGQSKEKVASTGRSASPSKIPAAARTGVKPAAGGTSSKSSSTTKVPTSTASKHSAKPAAKPGVKASNATTKTSKAKKPEPGGKDGGVAPEKKEVSQAVEPDMLSEEDQQKRAQEALDKALNDPAAQEARQKAWQMQVEADRRAEAKRRKKAEEEIRRRKEEASLRKALLEAAYDGEDGELQRLLDKAAALGMKDAVDTGDAHGNTLLSEAAAGGALSTVKLLLSLGADPNTQGEFKRTPLWRAAFLGKCEVVGPLLEGGADPRIGNEACETPAHVCASPEIKEQLGSWDTSVTDTLVARLEQQRAQRRAAVVEAARAAVKGAETQVEGARQEQERCTSALRSARVELEKRIHEYDTCVAEHKPEDLVKVTLDQIKLQEEVVAKAQIAAAAASEALSSARLLLREQQAQEQGVQGGEGGPEDVEDPPVGVLVDIKDLDEVLVRDVGGKIAASGRWPLVIDTSGQASVFLRYMDTNYVNALSSHALEPNRLRRSILGGLRYGKPVVLDLMDIGPLWGEMRAVFDRVQPRLLDSLLDKSLLKNDGYHALIRKEDGEEYEPNKFQDSRVARFSLIIHTSVLRPDPELVAATFPLRVLVRG